MPWQLSVITLVGGSFPAMQEHQPKLLVLPDSRENVWRLPSQRFEAVDDFSQAAQRVLAGYLPSSVPITYLGTVGPPVDAGGDLEDGDLYAQTLLCRVPEAPQPYLGIAELLGSRAHPQYRVDRFDAVIQQGIALCKPAMRRCPAFTSLHPTSCEMESICAQLPQPCLEYALFGGRQGHYSVASHRPSYIVTRIESTFHAWIVTFDHD